MITFRYRPELNKFGKLTLRPVADVLLEMESGKWAKFHPYIDSGADITLIPHSLGEFIGLSATNQKIEEIGGIAGAVPVVYVQHSIKIGDTKFMAKIGWALVDNVPPLLGRADVFDRFNVTFKQKEGKIIFEERK